MNEIALADLHARLDNLGLDSGMSEIDRARILRVGEKLGQLRRATTPEQFELFVAMMKLHKSDVEPVIDGLLLQVRAGAGRITSPLPEPADPVLRPLANRRERRRRGR